MASSKQQFDKLKRDIKKQTLLAERKTVRDANKKAVQLSSGPGYVGHPYSRKASSPPDNPEIINVQSGDFRKDWRSACSATGDGIQGQISNRNRVADWLDKGTRLMIPRPIRHAITQFVLKVREKNLTDRIKRL